MANFNIGLSALRTSQRALQVISNNVANAGTEGYHRRSVILESRTPTEIAGFRIGNGVGIGQIDRVRDQITESSLTNVIADVANVDQLVNMELQIESILLSGDDSIGAKIDQFFSEFTKLSATTDEPAQRGVVLQTADQLAGMLRDAANQLRELKNTVRLQANNEVSVLNDQMIKLSEVSQKILVQQKQGKTVNTELDQRDTILNQVARSLGVGRHEQVGGDLNLTVGNHSIQQGNIASQFTIAQVEERIELYLEDSARPIAVQTGRLPALMEVYNETIPEFEAMLDQIASDLIQAVNSVQATGVGDAGSFQNLVGNQTVSNPALPIQDALPNVDLSSGNLTISLTQTDGSRETISINIDPSTDTLADLGARLTAIPGIAASVRPNTNQFQIVAAPGIEFDFAGGPETNPDLSAFTGSSVPTVGGYYSSTKNETLTIRMEGTGQIGVASDLYANVYSGSGDLVSRVNIGLGYEAGSEIELGDGATLQLGAGIVNDTDEFDVSLTGNADETGLLSALGLNAFFAGHDASTIALDAELQRDPSRLATGRSGESSDTSNLDRFIAVSEQTMLSSGQTLSSFASEMTTEIGFRVNSKISLSSSLTAFENRLIEQRDSISGVDLNEELVYLQEYQKSYEAAVRIIQATDDMLNELFSILR